MTNTQEIKLPSFSLIFETENLASVELENIYRGLASLAAQDILPSRANEFLIIDGDYAPAEVIEQVCSKYPWITVKKFPGIGYYEAKMKGASLATGEIVIYCDSDCIYESNWLRDILTLFATKLDIDMVAGETVTPIRNIYELAIAMHYFFPRLSGQENPYVSNHYFLNNIAFKRDFLLKNPLPTQLPLYRGNCLLHAYYLSNLKGYKIWHHPQAKATHEPPTLSFITWRYLLRGRDRVLRKRIKSRLEQGLEIANSAGLAVENSLNFWQKISGVLSSLLQIEIIHPYQIKAVVKEDIRRLFLMPATIPFILWFELLYFLGSAITYLQPDLILKLYHRSEEKANESIAVQ